MSNRTQDLTLVLGATGKTGRRVHQRLAERGVAVRAGSRAGSPPFDWEQPATWAAALDGATQVYLAYAPDLAVPGSTATVEAFTRQAVEAGVRRIVLLSGRGEEAAQAAERVVAQAGVEWTVVRAAWFAQNFSEGAFVEPLLAGELALPVGDVAEPFVDVDDVADVAVAALTEEGHAGRIYELTGPRLVTFAEAVAEIDRAGGPRARFQRIPLDAFLGGAADAGESPEVVWLLGFLFGELFDGRNATLGDGVQQALGRPPRDLAEWARDAVAAGAWSGAAGGGEQGAAGADGAAPAADAEPAR
ncbi:NAD(P)H-binding protein [Conexibacter stalactiti]|uniref:NAD(P)H-binding protein n=1 Tax=Conexibacter stalactiti TaxID=1940611 RepID=A0ABU4HZ19_9ACTN|nr:NAD(P)H-binding protein [Conexibacter stalactiti]MDW5598577.1 NAD(P)H-binding protein [Conexibacter stalactiti]MEC5039219.1 NAD(P)H-binding protein [Conexibacter stalactiti]